MSFWSENPDEMEMHVMAAMVELSLADEDEDSMSVYERWGRLTNLLYFKVADLAYDKFMTPRILAAEYRRDAQRHG